MSTKRTVKKSKPAKERAAKVSTRPAPASDLPGRVAQAIALIQQAAEILAIDAPPLTNLDRRRLAKQRKGGEKHVPLIAHLAEECGLALRTQPTEAMKANAAKAAALRPLVAVLDGLLREVRDTGSVAASDSWSTAGALYSVLKRMSKRDPKLAAQLAPVRAFFAWRRPPAKAGKASKAGKTAKAKAGKEPAASQAPGAVDVGAGGEPH